VYLTTAAAHINLFAISTFDTDYVLVKAANVERACAALVAAGHRVKRDMPIDDEAA
jgi:hypothetical protein